MGGTVIALADDVNELRSRLQKLGYNRFLQPALTEGLQYEEPSRS
jgi:hypothetical protein